MLGLRAPTAVFVVLTLAPAAILAWLGWRGSDHWVVEWRRAARDQVERVRDELTSALLERSRAQDAALSQRLRALAVRAGRELPLAAPGAWLGPAEDALDAGALVVRCQDQTALLPRGPEPLAAPWLPEWRRFSAVLAAGATDAGAAAARALESPALRARALAVVLAEDPARLARELVNLPVRGLVAAGPAPCAVLARDPAGVALLATGVARGWLYAVPATETARLHWLVAAGAPLPARARQALRAQAEQGAPVLRLTVPLTDSGTLELLRDPAAALAALTPAATECEVELTPAAAVSPPSWDGPASVQLATPSAWGPVAVRVRHRHLPAIERDAARQRLWTSGGIGLLLLATVAGVVLARRALDRERRARALRDEFIANVSHELKTPLTSLRLYAEMLAADALAPAERARYGAVAQAEGARLSALIDDLLDFAALERGRRRIEPEPVDLAAAARAVGDAWQPRADQLGVALRQAAAAGEVPALVDPTALLRILTNLLQNAFRHGRPSRDGGPSHVTVAVGPGPSLEVRDNGPGVAVADRERIFGRFERGAGSVAGTGIGLAISRELAQACGGRLWCGDDGACTVFRLELPPVPAAELS